MTGRSRWILLGSLGVLAVAVLALVVGSTNSAGRRPVDDDFTEMLDTLEREANDAIARAPADVLAEDQAAPRPDEQFDEALWFSMYDEVGSAADLERYAPGVRGYFAIKMVEDEVANGGFAQVFENGVDEYFPAARAGYVILGDRASAELLDRAAAAADDTDVLNELDESLDDPPWNGNVPWSVAARVAYARAHPDEFDVTR
jgi:hypothetical protein